MWGQSGEVGGGGYTEADGACGRVRFRKGLTVRLRVANWHFSLPNLAIFGSKTCVWQRISTIWHFGIKISKFGSKAKSSCHAILGGIVYQNAYYSLQGALPMPSIRVQNAYGTSILGLSQVANPSGVSKAPPV